MSWPTVVVTFLYRLAKLTLLSAGVLPGLILFAPVFIASKLISIQKAKTALAGSSVKIQGRDVMATWKILVSMAFAPILYNFYNCILAYKVHQDRLWGRVPEWVPLWSVFLAGWIVFPAITFAALRFGEVGMDIIKSLRPLVLCIMPSSNYNIQRLRERRAELSTQVTDLINTLGPETFPDFEHTRLVPDPSRADGGPASPPPVKRRDSELSMSPGGLQDGVETPPTTALTRRQTTQSSRAIPRNESFSNIGQVQMFATRPPSRSRSRSSSSGGGFGMGGFPSVVFTALDSKEGFDEASKKIREAMRERGQMRRRKSQEARGGSFTIDDSDEEDGAEYDEARKKDA